MPNRSTVSWHVMIHGYIKIGNMEEARKIFESSPKAGTSWEAMICGYARHGMSKLTIEIFNRRLKNSFFTSQMLIAGYFMGDEWEPDDNHFAATYVPKDNNTATWNLSMEGNMYFGAKDGAEPIFEEMEKYNVNRKAMSWNSMITMLKSNQTYEGEITELFLKMPETLRHSHSWNLMMALPVTRGGISDEEQVTGMLHKARWCFDTMPPKNPHSWDLMIAGYLENEMVGEAKKIFVDKSIRVDDDLHSLICILG